jgi:hypothetical protein
MWKTILFAHDFSHCAAGVERTAARPFEDEELSDERDG